MATKIVRRNVFLLLELELVAIGVDVGATWSAGFPCCWSYTEAGIASGPAADELELGALGAELVPELVPGVAVAAYGVTQ